MSGLIVVAFDDEATGFEMRAELAKMQKDYLLGHFSVCLDRGG